VIVWESSEKELNMNNPEFSLLENSGFFSFGIEFFAIIIVNMLKIAIFKRCIGSLFLSSLLSVLGNHFLIIICVLLLANFKPFRTIHRIHIPTFRLFNVAVVNKTKYTLAFFNPSSYLLFSAFKMHS
jgi:hypothetical protein